MSWQLLLRHHRVQAHVTSRRELEGLRAVVSRDLTDVRLPGLSTDRQFATAYNAVLQLAKMAIACAGYRVVGTGHHQTTFEAIELAMGPTVANLASYFDTCRRKRNLLDYDNAQVVTETDSHAGGAVDGPPSPAIWSTTTVRSLQTGARAAPSSFFSRLFTPELVASFTHWPKLLSCLEKPDSGS